MKLFIGCFNRWDTTYNIYKRKISMELKPITRCFILVINVLKFINIFTLKKITSKGKLKDLKIKK